MALVDKFTATFALLPTISVWYDCKNKFKYGSYFFDSFVTCQFWTIRFECYFPDALFFISLRFTLIFNSMASIELGLV